MVQSQFINGSSLIGHLGVGGILSRNWFLSAPEVKPPKLGIFVNVEGAIAAAVV